MTPRERRMRENASLRRTAKGRATRSEQRRADMRGTSVTKIRKMDEEKAKKKKSKSAAKKAAPKASTPKRPASMSAAARKGNSRAGGGSTTRSSSGGGYSRWKKRYAK